MEERKIVKFYRYKEKDENDREIWLYCYALEDERGKVTYHFTKDEEKAKKIILKYLNDNYSSVNYKREIAKTPSIFNLNCSGIDDVAVKVKETSEDEKKEMKNFNKAQEQFYENDFEEVEEKQGKVTKARSWVANFAKDRIAGFKNASLKGKAVRIAATVFIATLVMNGCSAILNRFKSPTNNGPKSISGIDNDNTDDIKNNNDNDIDNTVEKITDGMKEAAIIAEKAIEETEAKIKAEQEALREAQKASDTNYDNSTGSNYHGSSGGANTKPTKEPGSVNEGYLGIQEPDASLGDSNSNDSSNTDNDTVDNPYQNVTEEEEPVKDEDNTNDEDYSEEIDVTVGNDVILDPELEGNEGAINDDISYDIVLDDNDGEYDIVYDEELPDPNLTAEAGDGNYVTTDEELTQTNSENDDTNNIDVVPVEQESQEPTVTIDTTYTEPGTIETVPVEQTSTINEQEVERAVEAMANGEEGNIVVNADGSISFDATENIETNSMTK